MCGSDVCHLLNQHLKIEESARWSLLCPRFNDGKDHSVGVFTCLMLCGKVCAGTYFTFLIDFMVKESYLLFLCQCAGHSTLDFYCRRHFRGKTSML